LSPPNELTAKKVTQFTKNYKEKGTVVWDKPYIKKRLLEMSHQKCAYCECLLVPEKSQYMEVEHFWPKKPFYEKVVEWENLLPSCKACNSKKGTHRTDLEPIIEPTQINPQAHLYLKAYRFYDKTSLGETTIRVLGLNRLTNVWFDIGEGIADIFSNVLEELDEFSEISDILKKQKKEKRIFRKIKSLLKNSQATSKYCAVTATILFTTKQDNQTTFYQNIKTKMQALDIWKEELTKLENEAKKYILEK